MQENHTEWKRYGEQADGEAKWEPVWLTLPEMADIHPLSLWHREQEPLVLSEEMTGRIKAYENLHVLARSCFTLSKRSRLHIRISADDRYKLYQDGGFIQEGPAPSCPEHYFYNDMELPLMEAGEHVLGVHLYYQGCINRVFYSADLRMALAAELRDEEGNGIPLDFWCRRIEAYSGNRTGYDTQFLENFDARKFPKGWNRSGSDWTKGLQEDAQWQKMVPARWAGYSLFPQKTKMLYHGSCQPQVIRHPADGTLFLDFGREITGNLSIRAVGKAGDTVTIRCGEELTDTGQVRYEMRCGCRYEEIWTLADGENVWEPYDYKGFRYAGLKASPGVVFLEIKASVRHYPMDEHLCKIRSSQPLLDRIFEICRNAVRLGTQEGYIDCPTREKGQYLGDALVTAHAQTFLTGETDMLLKCISQFAETENICPGLLAVTPGGLMQEIADFSLLYPELLLLHYRMSGDKRVLETYYDAAEAILEYFSGFAREDGLLDQAGEKWNLTDWPENLRDGYDFELSRPVVAKGCHNVINALYLGAAGNLVKMAEILDKHTVFQKKLPQMRAAYQKAFYRKETGLFADSETSQHAALHSNVYACYFGLALEEQKERIYDFIEEKGFSCGVMHSYFVMRTLAQGGRYDAVYRLLTNEGEHSWKQMLREGATACFEAWGKEQKWNTSLCHPWGSAPVPVIIEEIAGIHPDPACEGGYYFEPHIPDHLEEFHVKVPFQGRCIRVDKKGDRCSIAEDAGYR